MDFVLFFIFMYSFLVFVLFLFPSISPSDHIRDSDASAGWWWRVHKHNKHTHTRWMASSILRWPFACTHHTDCGKTVNYYRDHRHSIGRHRICRRPPPQRISRIQVTTVRRVHRQRKRSNGWARWVTFRYRVMQRIHRTFLDQVINARESRWRRQWPVANGIAFLCICLVVFARKLLHSNS